jgi:hypothetical protein
VKQWPEITRENARQQMDAAAIRCLEAVTPPFTGRGIVICGGGLRYFTCAWVCINILRQLRCKLPIQLWHLGSSELPDRLRSLIGILGVESVDAREIGQTRPVRILNGWEAKCFAILHSPFREVLLLDADNMPIIDPEFLFETPQFQDTGAIFWPDFNRLSETRSIWTLTGVPYQDEPEFESGQIVIDKSRSWQNLCLAMWMNENSDFWYNHIHGDKETFHMAWRKLNRPYSMPDRRIHALKGTMCQHDFAGRRIFQHRNMRKWSIDNNDHVPGFEMEDLCLEFIEQLKPYRRELRGFPAFDQELSAPLAGKSVDYRRIGHDSRPLTLLPDGSIGAGRARMEQYWGVRKSSDIPILELYGDDGVTARLETEGNNVAFWRGKWLIHEQMPIEIRVLSSV